MFLYGLLVIDFDFVGDFSILCFDFYNVIVVEVFVLYWMIFVLGYDWVVEVIDIGFDLFIC